MEHVFCIECRTYCSSFTECKTMQAFNVIVDNAHAMAQLRKNIKGIIPNFRGKSSFFSDIPSGEFVENSLNSVVNWNQRFLTITFDPRKFSTNELTQPIKLHNYVLNALWELRFVFCKNIILIREFHKSGIPHYHLNYSCATPLDHACLLLRLKYYFAKDLRNRNCIHDRYFNNGGIEYMKKANYNYWTYAEFLPEAEQNLIEPEGPIECDI